MKSRGDRQPSFARSHSATTSSATRTLRESSTAQTLESSAGAAGGAIVVNDVARPLRCAAPVAWPG